MVWSFTPEQLQDPDKVVEYLKGKCCGYSKETQLAALCWALATIYQTLLDSRQHHQGEERENRPTGTADTQAPATGTVAEPKDQPIPVSVTPIHKKKYTRKLVCLVKDDDELGPSREQEEEPEPEVMTRSLSLSELRDRWKDFSRLPGEHIITWLLHCWDNRASSLELEGREAKQLGSLSREGGIDKAIGKKAQALSLWRRLLSSVRERYPFSEDVLCRPGKWTPMERGIQYLRELAVREMVYYDPDNVQLPTDPDEVQCTRPMWQKFVWSAPSSYTNSLAVMDWKSEEAPTVDEVAGRLRQYEESLSSSLVSAVEKLSQEVRQLKEDISYSPPVQTSISAVRSPYVNNISWLERVNCKTSCSLGTQPPELEDRDGEQNEAPIIQGEMVSDLLHHLDTHKSMGPDGIHPRALRELAEALTKPLSIIYQQSWLSKEVPVDWKLANVMPIYRKGQKEDLGNYRPVSLTSVLGKAMEQIILSAITWHIQDNQVIRSIQHGFLKGRSCLTILISFYDKVTCLVDEAKAVDVVYLDFRKAFDTVSHSILLEKLAAHGLDGCTLRWGYDLIGIMETWWDGSYDWSVGMEGYRLFRKDRQGRQGGGIALYVNDQLECMELHLGMEEELTERLWVRIKGSAGTGDIIVGVCYRPPDQGD
ncbi:ubiquitin carboxyl-terminal hydrolase 4 [Grus japonensis]|uniref:Ubiquitin carboxyl-terminal hydrolase 4 n=1 Tax=Grus japonensis TaxID=30415 RepID=A0ABC9YDG0_GRUJA